MGEAHGSITLVMGRFHTCRKFNKRYYFVMANVACVMSCSPETFVLCFSLMWSHTWLLHATRAMRSLNHTLPLSQGARISDDNALDSIKVSHRPKGGNEWLDGYGKRQDDVDFESKSNIGDTGTSHPHGTKVSATFFVSVVSFCFNMKIKQS